MEETKHTPVVLTEENLGELMAWSEMTDETRRCWGPEDAERLRGLVHRLLEIYAIRENFGTDLPSKWLEKGGCL